MERKRLISIALTIAVISILLISGPANAIVITIDGDSAKDMSTSSTLAVANMNATINIESSERINLQNYTIIVTNSSGTNLVTCYLYLNGTEISGCDYINNTQVTYNSANYTSGNRYGYGYTSSNIYQTYGYGYGSEDESGYGYGDAAGISDEVVITFDWEFQKQAKAAGLYNVNVRATATDGSEQKVFTSKSVKGITLSSASVTETVLASEVNTSSTATIGGGNITIPADTGFIDTDNFTGNVATYIKGIVGVTGNVTFNVSIGEGIGGVTASNVTTDSDDVVLNIYFDINGTIDTDLGYADIYIAIPNSTIDAINSSGLSNVDIYILHNDGTSEIKNLTRHSSLDSTTYYMYSVRITEFSIFAPFYNTPAAATEETTTTTTSSRRSSSTAPLTNTIIGESVTQVWGSITAGVPVTMKISKPEIPITELIFTTINDLKGVQLTVSELTDKPDTRKTLTPAAQVYKYIQVSKKGISDSDLETVEITFSVPRSWLDERAISEDDIILARHNGEWNEITTRKISSTSDKVIYKATTPKLSYFAITTKQAVKSQLLAGEEEPVPEETESSKAESQTARSPEKAVQEEAPEKAPEEPTIPLGVGITILLLALVLAISLIFYRRMKNRGSQ